VDLRPPVGVLWAGLRKSYRQDVEKVRATHLFGACSSLDMPRFKAMHTRQAGKQTRPDASWDLMAGWVDAGLLVLVAGWTPRGCEPEGFAAFERWGQWAYYGHAATDVPKLGHGLVWQGMLELKARGVERLELGWQGEAADGKGQGIEFFRRGFGGVDVPAREGEGQWS
jgi:hypothetical protein